MMIISSATRKYARALVEVAAETSSEDEIEKGLATFRELIDLHEELLPTLSNPAISLAAKKGIVRELEKTVPFPRQVANFLLILIERNRIDEFEETRQAYQEILDERRGILRGEVVSSRELDPELKERIQKAISDLMGTATKISYRFDESLIGGLRLQIGSTVYDGSIRMHLEEIRRRLAR